MRCDEAQEMLAREDGGRLSLDQQRALSTHLVACTECQGVAHDQRMVAEILASRPDAQVSPGFADRVVSALDAQESWVLLADWRRWTLRLAPVAAGLALAAVLVPSTMIEASGPQLEQVTETLALGDREGETTMASLFWQPDVDPDTLLVVAVTGSADWLSGEEPNEP